MTDLAAIVRCDQHAIRCPHPLFADLRRDDPVHFSQSLGAWVATRFDGEHWCIGARLARAEARIGTNVAVDRLIPFALADDDFDLDFEDTFVPRGLRPLHVGPGVSDTALWTSV